MALSPPERIWWKPLNRAERLWVSVAAIFLLALFATMPLWHVFGKQHTPGESYRVDPASFRETTSAFINSYQVRTEGTLPVVRPPEGDVYLMAYRFAWSPILELQAGKTYRLHISSTDVNHGFSLQPVNMNFQVVPGYDLVLTITPPQPGVYTLICNQYCGLGHQLMSGKIIVRG